MTRTTSSGLGGLAPRPLLFFLLLLPPPLYGDGSQTGIVSGRVVDERGNTLPGVEVTLSGEQARRQLSTDERGAFRFVALAVGRYDVTAELLGMTAAARGVQVFIDNTTEVRLVLGAEAATDEAGSTGESEWIEVVAQAPVADRFDPRVGAEIGFDFLDELPVQRFYQSVALVLPGVAGGEDGNPQTSGGLRSNNLFLVDGVDTTDPTTGLFGLNVNYEAVEGVDVVTAGPTAEYGRVSGAVVNVVTRSGGNRYEGLLRLVATNNDWDEPYDFPPEQIFHLAPEIAAANSGPDEIDATVALTLGGPVAADRLWFFAAYEDSEDTFLAPARTGESWNRGVDLRNTTLKLTARPASSHRLVLQTSSDEALFDAFTPFERGPSENRATSIPTPLSLSIVDRLPGDLFALEGRRQEGNFVKLQWTAALGQDFSLTLTAADQGRRLERDRLNSRGLTEDAPHVAVTRFRAGDSPEDPIIEELLLFNGVTDRGYEERPRRQANLVGDWYLTAGRTDHELRFGVDYQETDSERFFNFAGRQGFDRATGRAVQGQLFIDFDTRASCLEGGECIPFDPASGEFQPLLLFNFWNRQERRSMEEVAALHASDTVVAGRWVLTFGARLESMEGSVEGGVPVVSDDVLAPRLHLTYDSRGDGTALFSIGAGRYYEPFLQQYLDTFTRLDLLSGFTEYEWGLPFAECRTQDPSDVDSPCWLPRGLQPFVRVQAGAPNLELARSYVDELIVSFERQLTAQTAFSLHYIDRSWDDLWDNVLQVDFSGEEPRIRSEILNIDPARREYRGIQLLFQKLYARNWQLLGSYTWSQTEGHFFQNDGLSDFADYSEVADLNVVNRFGLAPYDREHRFRLFANYQIPWPRQTLSLGAVLAWESGVPYQAELSSEFGRRFLQPRGSERLGERLGLDVSAALDLRVGAGVVLEIKAEAFNLTNEQEILGVETLVDTGLFGLPRDILDLQPPRSFRLLLGVRF